MLLTEWLKQNQGLTLIPLPRNPRGASSPIDTKVWLELIEVYRSEPTDTQIYLSGGLVPSLYNYHLEGGKIYKWDTYWESKGRLGFYLQPFFEISQVKVS